MTIKVTIIPYMNPQAYANGLHSSDYMIDQIFHGFRSISDVLVQQIPQNPIMFSDCPKEEIQKSWGFGFSLYGLLPNLDVNFPIEDSDIICCALHHTAHQDLRGFHRATKDLISRFGKKVICIDGHDFPDFMDETAELCLYFKRELLDDRKAIPIFFAIPEEKINNNSVNKVRDFSSMVPTMMCWNDKWSNNYHKWDNESDYYRQYQESYFGINIKKGGWGTGRLQEICANDCLPYWTDIELMPKNTYHNLNRELFQEVKRLNGVVVNKIEPLDVYDTRNIRYGEFPGYIDWDKFEIDKYTELLKEIKEHCRKDMTTKSLAAYLLEKSL